MSHRRFKNKAAKNDAANRFSGMTKLKKHDRIS